MNEAPAIARPLMDKESKPCLYLDDMPPDFVEGLTVGQEVRVVLVGKVKGVGQRTRHEYDDKGKKETERTVSHMDVEYSKGDLKVNAVNKDLSDVLDDE